MSSREAAQHFVLAERDLARHQDLERHIRSLWNGPRCRVVRCGTCGLCRADPFVGGDGPFYALAYQRTHYPGDKWEYRLTRRALADLRERPARLLEIGAGDGAFLRTVTPSTFAPDRVLATEFSDYGVRAVRALGIRCEPVDVRALPVEHDGTFDVICMFQVLEHLDGLDAVCTRLRALARGAATLFVAVPNDRQIAFNERHGALLDMPPNHITRWTGDALRLLGARHGWRLVEHRTQDEPLPAMARRFLEYRYLRAAQRAGSIPNRIRSTGASRLQRALDAAWIAATLPWALPALVRLGREAGGDSQWAHFVRER